MSNTKEYIEDNRRSKSLIKRKRNSSNNNNNNIINNKKQKLSSSISEKLYSTQSIDSKKKIMIYSYLSLLNPSSFAYFPGFSSLYNS